MTDEPRKYRRRKLHEPGCDKHGQAFEIQIRVTVRPVCCHPEDPGFFVRLSISMEALEDAIDGERGLLRYMLCQRVIDTTLAAMGRKEIDIR